MCLIYVLYVCLFMVGCVELFCVLFFFFFFQAEDGIRDRSPSRGLGDVYKRQEFAEKYFRQGMRISVSGRIQTGSYTNKDGVKVYTTVVIVEEQEFAESKSESKNTSNPVEESSADDGFMNLTDEYDDELPFH